MDELEKEVTGFALKVLAKPLVRWVSDRLGERHPSLILLEIPRPAISPKKPKKHQKKKSVRRKLPPPSEHGKFCPECGQERR
jgi:hypothetical protein